MARKTKGQDVDLYYMNHDEFSNDKIDKMMKQKKERKKRINQDKKQREKIDIDPDTETVIQMTNRNRLKQEEQRRRQLNRQEQKRKKRNKKIKLILKIVLLIGIIAGGTTFAFTSPIFQIQTIEVVNNNHISADTIVSISELKPGDNIFSYNIIEVKDKIREHAYVKNVKIYRKLPNKVQIEIEERTPKYSLDFMGKFAYINSQGYILEIADENNGMPVISGIHTPEEDVVPNKRLIEQDLIQLEDVTKIVNTMKETEAKIEVTNINISDEKNYIVYVESEKKRIHLGDVSNLSNKMLYILSIFEEEKGKEGDIYANGELNNKFKTYFREKV